MLRAGTWPAHPRDLTLTDADLSAIAAAYEPAAYRAPVVIGHPEDDHPAYGWALGLSLADDGLWAEVEVTPELVDAIEAGHYRAVSVSLWPPGASGNPKPEGWSLKHIGFLGAKPPAVKGLAPRIRPTAAILPRRFLLRQPDRVSVGGRLAHWLAL
ncbi:MAG: hypothetical protein DYH17_15530, partial [Xanthomonadales bacterium PRO6]|nr:hypothetical protein [Xanthomonadales bacterium PRO6]